MKQKNKIQNKEGFIQIPILIAIIVGIIITGGAGYFGVEQYKNYQVQKIEKEKLVQESEKSKQEKEEQNQELAKIQQEALEKTKQETERLREEIQQESEKLTQQLLEEKEKTKQETEKVQQQQKELEQKIKEFEAKDTATEKNTNTIIQITSEDLEAYRYDIGKVDCYQGGTDWSSGSGSLWNFADLSGVYVLTNDHVITSNTNTNRCTISFDKKGVGQYELDTNNILTWNEDSDIAVLKILRLIPEMELLNFYSASELSSNISSLAYCEEKALIGSPVAVVGYPAFAEKIVKMPGSDLTGTTYFQATTEGTVSAYDTSVMWPYGDLPHNNYFISAKIDAGNSGGIAFSKDKDGLCVLGVPTWVSIGVYETQGLVQNIHNVFYVK